MEMPQYTLYLSLKRILIPKSVTLIFLGLFLYIGLLLNMLILNKNIRSDVNFYIVLGIFVLIFIQGIINYLKYSSYRYIFYSDRIIFQGKRDVTILYSEIQSLNFKRDFLDKLFNTGTISLSPIHNMEYVENTNQVYFYIQKLLEYSNQVQNSMRLEQGDYAKSQMYYQRQV